METSIAHLQLVLPEKCVVSSDCVYNQCVNSRCTIPEKACPSSTSAECSGHGTCVKASFGGGMVPSCLLNDFSCAARCSCSAGYGGVDCSVSPTQVRSSVCIRLRSFVCLYSYSFVRLFVFVFVRVRVCECELAVLFSCLCVFECELVDLFKVTNFSLSKILNCTNFINTYCIYNASDHQINMFTVKSN